MTAASITLTKQYVEQHESCYRLVGSRVSLDSVVYSFRDNRSPEKIVQSFPTLSLEQVYGAIAFYLANREIVDVYLEEGEAEFSRRRQDSQQNNAELYAKLEAARAQNL
jgi:uncharacterized protein (DUF433 family)